MTDAEIIKALEYHKDESNKCRDCAYGKGKGCSLKLAEDTLDLINRQKAEIERLKGYNKNLQIANTALSNEILDIKAEAIKEFAERLKANNVRFCCECGERINTTPLIGALIDNLVKEMAGEAG